MTETNMYDTDAAKTDTTNTDTANTDHVTAGTGGVETIKYEVLIEKVGDNGYRANVLAWPGNSVEAATREEALKKIRSTIQQKLTTADLVTLEFPVANPWLKFAGMWADNPDFDEFVGEIDRFRREIDMEQSPWLFEAEGQEHKEKVVVV